MLKDYEEFVQSLNTEGPISNWSDALKSLWYDAKGDWEASHNIAQDMHNEMGSWIHAYLHRKEGDKFNAGYWYRQVRKSYPKISLEDEFQAMVEFIISKK